MEENLKTIRTLHQVLMLLCLAVVAFASVPDQSEVRRKAILELTTIRALGIRSYARFVNDSFREENSELAKEINSQLALAAPPTVYRTFYCDWPAEKGSVNEYLAFFDTQQFVAFFSAAPDEMPQLYRMALHRYAKQHRGSRAQLRSIAFGLSPAKMPQLKLTDEVSLLLNPGLKVNDSRLDLNERIEASETTYEIHVEFEFPDDAGSTSYEEITGGSVTTTLPFDPQKWLNATDNGKGISLAALHSVANEVGGMSIAEAVQSLQGKIDAANREVAFGGVTVDSRLAFWFAPSVILMLLLYLLLHIFRLRTSHVEDALFHSFPWVGLFRGPGGILFTFSSLVVLPTLTAYLLSRRFDPHGLMMRVSAIGLIITIFVVGISCFLVSLKLHKAT